MIPSPKYCRHLHEDEKVSRARSKAAGVYIRYGSNGRDTNHNYFTTENPPNNNKPTCPNSTPKQSSFSKPLSLSDSTSTSPKPNWADYPSSSSSSASSSSSDTSDSSQPSSDDDDKLESSSTGDEENQDSSESVATSEHTSRSEDSEDLDSELPGSINFSFPSNPLVEEDQAGETLTTMDDSSSLMNNQIITVSNANHNSTTFVIKKSRQNYIKTPPLQSNTIKKPKSRSQLTQTLSTYPLQHRNTPTLLPQQQNSTLLIPLLLPHELNLARLIPLLLPPQLLPHLTYNHHSKQSLSQRSTFFLSLSPQTWHYTPRQLPNLLLNYSLSLAYQLPTHFRKSLATST